MHNCFARLQTTAFALSIRTRCSPGAVAREVSPQARPLVGRWGLHPMGCFNSKEAGAGNASSGSSRPAAQHKHGGGHAKPKPAAPDAMLAKSFEYIQQLGKGGTGDTGLFKDLQSGEEVAIKLIKRPLPKVIMPNILREVTVRGPFVTPLCSSLCGQSVTQSGHRPPCHDAYSVFELYADRQAPSLWCARCRSSHHVGCSLVLSLRTLPKTLIG